MSCIREQIEAREAEHFSPYAALASRSKGRLVDEPKDDIRTCFMQDRDRIVHSKSFRRLMYKTQVFIAPEGDHYRSRLTHSLEVAQIARTIGRSLQLNEDLIEAISLGHDLGHSPFGHAGEFALDEAIKSFQMSEFHGFDHAKQSLRVVDVLESLNLSFETRHGIGDHRKRGKDISAIDGEIVTTLEAAVVKISDRIAYLNHDIDDAIRAKVIDKIPKQFDKLGNRHSVRVGQMVSDVIKSSLHQSYIAMSPEILLLVNGLKTYLFENVYNQYPVLYPDINKAQGIVNSLFLYYVNEGDLPDGFIQRDGKFHAAIDYVSGMTDRFAIADFERIRLPRPFAPES